jgi:TolB protein
MARLIQPGALLFGVFLLLIGGILTLARSDSPTSPWVEYSVLSRAGRWIQCRYIFAERAQACESPAESVGVQYPSPDGRWSVYISSEGFYQHLYLKPRNETEGERLTPSEATFEAIGVVDWSSDAKWIVFNAIHTANVSSFDLYRLDLDTRRLTRLTQDAGLEIEPSISPDNRQIVYNSQRSGLFSPRLSIIDLESGTQKDVSPFVQYTSYPDWSPSGEWILFQSDCLRLVTHFRQRRESRCELSDFDIYKIRADGSELTALTRSTYDDYGARWSPDGAWVAFSRRPLTGNPDIFRLSSNGGAAQPLTDTLLNEVYPQWPPLFDDGFHVKIWLTTGLVLILLGGWGKWRK